MPAVKTKTLRSPAAVAGLADYLLDERHRNHAEYRIHAPAGAETGKAMAARLERGLEILNEARSGSHQIKVRGWLAIVRFPDGSDLTADERDQVETTMLSGFDLPASSPRAWHVNRLTKSCDFNVIIGALRDVAVPLLRRWEGSSLRARLIHLADAVTDSLNELRAKVGRKLIDTMASVQRRQATDRRGESIEMVLARTSLDTDTPITRTSLPRLLLQAGYAATDWDWDDDHLWIRLGKLRLRQTKLSIDSLLTHSRDIADGLKKSGSEQMLKLHAALDATDKGQTRVMQAPRVSDKPPTQLDFPP